MDEQKKIDAVKYALLNRGVLIDGRVGFALSKIDIAEKGSGWSESRYYLKTRPDETLTAAVRMWAVDHGLAQEVKAFDKEAMDRYCANNKDKWQERLEEAQKELER